MRSTTHAVMPPTPSISLTPTSPVSGAGPLAAIASGRGIAGAARSRRRRTATRRGLACAIFEGTSQKGLASARDADEQRIDAFVQGHDVVESEVASTKVLADGIEAEVEAVNPC